MALAKSVWFALIFFLFLKGTNCSDVHYPVNERQALLNFKQGLLDPSDRLSSWVGEACCEWKGVGCNYKTGHVVKLDLRNSLPFNEDNINIWNPNDTANEKARLERASLRVHVVNSSILELKHLNYLDLSWNNFSGLKIPKFFGSFQELRYLNLSSAWFGGPVPHHLGNLSALRSLDLSTEGSLSDNYDNIPELIVDTFQWISTLFNLQKLDMSGLDLTDTRDDSSRMIIPPPELLELHLFGCGIGKIPFFHSHSNLTSLVILDLSDNYFEGPIPSVIRNMTSLKVLDLSYNKFNSSGPILDKLKNLKRLELLELSYNKFGIEAVEHFGKFSSPHVTDNLETLYLSNNLLKGYLPSWLYQLKYLKFLDLSFNSFHGPIPVSFGGFPSLKQLDLSSNNLNRQIPTSLGKLSSLEIIRLSSNNLSGPIPTSLGRLSVLSILDLSSNKLIDQIPTSFGRLSNLEELYLSSNQLNGQIPTSFKRLLNLTTLHIHHNELSGQIPVYFGEMVRNLTELDLSHNQLNGSVPESLGQLLKVTKIDLSSNSLSGVLSEVHFAKLSQLDSLALSMNSLSLKIRSGWVPPFRLTSIDLGSCVVGPQFPHWLQTQTGYHSLNMSNSGISDSIPNWFENLSSRVYLIDLSNNKIYGKVPNLIKSSIFPMQLFLSSNEFEGPLPPFPLNLATLDLSNNTISGKIPKNLGDTITTVNFLGLSNNYLHGSIPNSFCKLQSLYYLDLSKNNLSGDLPLCWNDLQILEVIDLTSNNLSGTIPRSFGQLPFLRSLHLSNNIFHGELSSALRYCTSLSILDLGENSLSGNIPSWIGESLPYLKILRLTSNKYDGSIPRRLCNLKNLHILDVSHNNLSGYIPQCIGNLSAMVLNRTKGTTVLPRNALYTDKLTQVIKGRELEYFRTLVLLINLDFSSNNLVGKIPDELTRLSGLVGLNLSKNHLIGNIPKNIGQIRSLESLDLSFNHLSGTIPQNISLLSSLSHLNLSYNKFSGPIPTGYQLQTLEDPSIYKGNHELCGPPLEKQCIKDEPPRYPAYGDRKGNEFRVNWFYIGVASGYATGFWFVCAVLLFKKTWRYAYFQFVNDIKDKIYVAFMTKIVRVG